MNYYGMNKIATGINKYATQLIPCCVSVQIDMIDCYSLKSSAKSSLYFVVPISYFLNIYQSLQFNFNFIFFHLFYHEALEQGFCCSYF